MKLVQNNIKIIIEIEYKLFANSIIYINKDTNRNKNKNHNKKY